MGQQKGNQIPTTQEQAYMSKYGLSDHTKRDMGTKPVMIDDNTTLNAVIDATFGTDVDISTLQAAVQTKLSTADAITTYKTSASLVNTLASSVVFGGTGGGHASDAIAASNGVPVGGLYHTAGTVKVRLT